MTQTRKWGWCMVCGNPVGSCTCKTDMSPLNERSVELEKMIQENKPKEMTAEEIVSDWQNTYAPNEVQFIKSDIENEGYWYTSKCGTHSANLKLFFEELIDYYEEKILPIKTKRLKDRISELEQWKKE